MGDFHPATSDVDIAVVLDPRPQRRQLMPALDGLLSVTRQSPNLWMQRLEAFFYSRRDLQCRGTVVSTLEVPAIEPGRAVALLEEVGPEIFLYRCVLREHGITVSGLRPDEVIAPVPRQALERGIGWVARRWVTGWFREPEQLEPVPFRLFAVLTCCRLLFTQQHGFITTKAAAAQWAAAALASSTQSETAAVALAARGGAGAPPSVEEAMSLIRHTLARLGIEGVATAPVAPASLWLEPFQERHLPLVEPWFHDSETQKWLGGPDWPRQMLELQNRPLGEFRGARETGRFRWIALLGGEAVGYVDCGTYDRWTTWEGGPNGRGVVSAIPLPSAGIAYVVKPELRRQGICVRMLAALLDQPAVAHVRLFGAGVEPDNVGSIRCLLRAGFRPLADRPDWEGMVYYMLRRRG